MSAVKESIASGTVAAARALEGEKYKHGFVTALEQELAPPGLNEGIVRYISAKKDEPDWMLAWRLEAFRRWQTMEEPTWALVRYPPIDYQAARYYAAPKSGAKYKSIEDVEPEILETYKKLGIPLREAGTLLGVEGAPRVAVDAVFDSVSVVTTFKAELAKAGVIFCPISEAIREHPELVKQYLGSVVPTSDNFFATLNSAVFSDGSFVYVPEGVRCPMELSTYFRMNAQGTGQFERTLIIADKGAYVSYLEGCTAPMRDENQLHAAVVELVALDDAEIKYSTVQNWWPGDSEGKGGIYNFVTKRGDCRGKRAKISWTQVETGSAITWKYPSCILRGDESSGEFYSIAVTNGRQQADTGTKMVHLGQQHPLTRHLQRHFRRPLLQRLSRPRFSPRQSQGRAQFHSVRFALDWRPMRRPHRALRRDPHAGRAIRARSDDNQALQRSALLPALARRAGGSSGGAAGQRLRARSVAETADGVRGGGAEAAGSELGGERGMSGKRSGP